MNFLTVFGAIFLVLLLVVAGIFTLIYLWGKVEEKFGKEAGFAFFVLILIAAVSAAVAFGVTHP